MSQATNILKKYIKDWLKAKFPTISNYSEDVPQNNATYPRIIYRISSSDQSSFPREDFGLMIQIHSNKTDTTDIDILAGNIVGDGDLINPTGLNFLVVNQVGLEFHSYLTSRDEELTSEQYQRQRNLSFILKTYFM